MYLHTRSIVVPNSTHPPIILTHGGATDGTVFRFWQQELAERGWSSYALDQRGHGHSGPADLLHVSMSDYVGDVRIIASQLARKPVIIGWSVGGLTAIMAAAAGLAAPCVAMDPEMPVRQRDPATSSRLGPYVPPAGYQPGKPIPGFPVPDLDPEEHRIAMSSLHPQAPYTRYERQRGVVVEKMPCPLLIVSESLEYRMPHGSEHYQWLGAEYVVQNDVSHWGQVLNRRALGGTVSRVVAWLDTVASGSAPTL